jgi:hypothetical protein
VGQLYQKLLASVQAENLPSTPVYIPTNANGLQSSIILTVLEESARNEESPQLPDSEADEAADNQGFSPPSEEVNEETLGEKLDIDAGSNASDEMETDTEEDTECGYTDLSCGRYGDRL